MPDDALSIVNRFMQAISRRNVDELVGFFVDDGVYDNVPMQAARGKDAIRRVLESYLPAAQSADFKVLRSAVAGDVVFNERLDVFEVGGKRVELPIVGVFEVRGGKIALWRDYFDLATWTRQMA